jgi:putative hydrolase of the HAD superfamily
VIKAVLIDFGHTLVKQHTDEGKLLKRGIMDLAEYLKLKGYRLTPNELEHVENELRCEANRFREKTLIEIKAVDRIAALLNRFGIPAGPDEALVWESSRLIYKPLVEDMMLFQDSLNFLRTLKKDGYKLALVSNAASDQAIREALNRLGIARFFDAIIISSQVGLRKPSSAVFMKALKALNVKPGEAVFIGDSMKDDITGAKKISMKTILLSRRSARVKPNVSDAVVTTLADVVPILNNWKKPKAARKG